MSEVCAHGNLKRQCETCAAWESAVHNQRRAEKAEARVKELERERDDWKWRAERAEGQNCESCGCSIEVPDGSGFVAWVCAACWNTIVCARDGVRRELADKQWVIATMTADIERAGGVVTFHDGGMGQSPSGYHRKPYVQMKGGA